MFVSFVGIIAQMIYVCISMDVRMRFSLLACAGSVKVWDIRQSDPVVDISPSEGQHKRDCWTVAMGA